MDDLERAENTEENVETTETVEAPSKEETPTLKYSEEDWGKAQSSWDRQITLSKAEVKRVTAEAEQFKAEQKHSQAYIQSLKNEMDKLAGSVEDPEVMKTYTSRMASLDREMTIAKRESEAEQKFYEAEKLAWSVGMARKASELIKETGIKMSELEECQTEEEMEVKALRFKMGKPKKKPEDEEGEKTPKFAGGGEEGKGVDWRKLSPQQQIDYGLKHMKK